MTALAANSPHLVGSVRSRTKSYVVKSAAVPYAGGLIGMDANGVILPWSDTAGLNFLGQFTAWAVSFNPGATVAGDGSIRGIVDTSGALLLKSTVAGATTRALALAGGGALVYCADDNPATFSLTASVNARAVGRCVDFITATTDISVQLFTPAEYNANAAKYSEWDFPMTLSLVANGNMVTGFVPGFAGRIISLQSICTTAVTTGSKAASINAEIDAVDVTGGVVALTSANQTPIGARVAGSAVTAANRFTATSAIDIEAASVTTFVEGAVVIKVLVLAD